MIKLVLLTSLLTAVGAWAKPSIEDEPPIKKGTQVQVEAWNEKSRTYDIVMPQFEAQGPNYAAVEDMLAAISSLDRARVTANPRVLVGNEYVLDNDLKLQPGGRVEALRRGSAPSPGSRKRGMGK